MLNTRAGENYNANDVINANDLRKRILNIDSRFRSNPADPVGDFQYRLEHTYKNIIRMQVTSVEIPNTFYTFTTTHQNTTFTVSTDGDGGIPRSLLVTLPNGNYTASELVTNIQNQFDAFANITGIFLKISVNINTGRVSLTNLGIAPITSPPAIAPTLNANPTTFNFLVIPPSIYNQSLGLGYSMGFRLPSYTPTVNTSGVLDTYTIVGEAVIDVVGENYLLLGINDLHTVEQRTDTNYFQVLAKVVVREDKNMVIYDDRSCCITNEIIFPQPLNLSVLHISLKDPYGGIIDLNGLNYSITIEITEVLNTRLYDFYRNYIWLGTVPSIDLSKSGGGVGLLGGQGPPF
jgi:hypothetical protein